jgi:hypothetical protein
MEEVRNQRHGADRGADGEDVEACPEGGLLGLGAYACRRNAATPTTAKPTTEPSMNKSASALLGMPRACVSTAPEVQTVSV